MIRKWMTALLSLLLALMLPLCAMAGVQHTLTIIPGDELASEPAAADLLDVLSLTVTPGQKSGALTLSLDGTEIATVAIGADATGLYAHSNLLSDDVLYVTWDDAFALLKDMLRTELIDESVNNAGIESMLSQVDDAKEQLVAALGSGVAVNSGMKTQEEIIAEAEAMFKDDPEMVAYITDVYEKMTVEDGAFTAENRDAADQKYSLTMTEQDVLRVLDTKYMYQAIWNTIEQGDPDLGGDNLAEMTEAQLAEMRELMENSDMDLKMDVYTLDAGETLVGMEMDMTMTVKEENDSETAKMLLTYNRLTDEQGVNHLADMDLLVDDEKAMQLLFDFTRGNNAVSEGRLAFLVDGEEMTIAYRAENTMPDVREREAALYLRSEAASIIPPAASSRPLITFKVVSSPADPDVLSKIENADASSSVNVLKLSDEEMQALVGDVTSRAMQAVYMALAKLPTSVLNLLMGEGM